MNQAIIRSIIRHEFHLQNTLYAATYSAKSLPTELRRYTHTPNPRYHLIKNKKSFFYEPFTNFSGFQRELKSHTCGELRPKDVGTQVQLRGFLQYQRMGLFCILRDAFGSVQIIINSVCRDLKDVPYESYIQVCGKVTLRPNDQINHSMGTGEIEVSAEEIIVLNKANKEIPFLIRKANRPTEKVGLTHRYLDLRHDDLQHNLRFRSKLGKRMRDVLQDEMEFVEVTTPTLSLKTPGGSQEFVVPSQTPDLFYSLVQSPQTYKQLAVIGGIDKYFQFAVCYRDEGGKPDRQPEFMQLDLELSDTSCEEVQSVVERLVVGSWPHQVLPAPCIPFPRMTYREAMETYGVDKPDTRFGWKLRDVTSVFSSSSSSSSLFGDEFERRGDEIKGFVIPQGKKYVKNSVVKKWKEIATREVDLSGLMVLAVEDDLSLRGMGAKGVPQGKGPVLVEELGARPGDTIVLAFGQKPKVLKLLGKVRLLGCELLEREGVSLRAKSSFHFMWVIDFPLFERDEGGVLASSHHPFTAPIPQHAHLLHTHPDQVTSQHYDLVLNGSEVGGGSVRIHDADTQRTVFDVLGVRHQPFHFFLRALESGAPPHGGIAIGFDRYVNVLVGGGSVRDVMAFPKTSEGKCLLTGAPAPLSPRDKELYHLNKHH